MHDRADVSMLQFRTFVQRTQGATSVIRNTSANKSLAQRLCFPSLQRRSTGTSSKTALAGKGLNCDTKDTAGSRCWSIFTQSSATVVRSLILLSSRRHPASVFLLVSLSLLSVVVFDVVRPQISRLSIYPRYGLPTPKPHA